MRTVLMIAFHYPPAGYSSGLQRTLKFSRYLGEFGWRPVVLTANRRAYPLAREDQLADVGDDVVVSRAFALDASRHLRVLGRYPRIAALPDPWASWWLGAVMRGRRLLKKHRPSVLWSTYPIATAHWIARTLRDVSGLPWVADFRDPMVEGEHPPDERQRRAYRRIEANAVRRSSRAVFTTEGARGLYQERYPDVPPSRMEVIPNGYDEENFIEAERLGATAAAGSGDRPFVLLHSGALYLSERDPRSFFAALAALRRSGRVGPDSLRVVLRAPRFVDQNRRLIDDYEIGEIVHLETEIPYRAALREMLDADGLLVLQASNCNNQVPAKLYEYLRARRPILALTDPRGDTAGVLRRAGVSHIAPLDDEEGIGRALLSFLEDVRSGAAPVASDGEIASHSRHARTRALAAILDEVASSAAGAAE